MSTLAVIATSTLTGVIGAAAMYVPARLALRDARTYRDEADRTFGAAESLADEVERTRNLPWHYAAIEAAPEDKPVIGEVLRVEPHETGEHPVVACCDGHDVEPCDPATYAVPCCGDCPEWSARTAAMLSDQPEHDDEDAPADDTDRPGLHLALLAIPVALWDRLREWWRALWAARRERHMVGSGEQATDVGSFGEELAHVEASLDPVVSSANDDIEVDEDFEQAVMAAEAQAWVDANPPTPYRGKHWAAGTEHTDLHPIVVPAQRSGDADE